MHYRTASDTATSLEQGCTCTRHERRTLTTRFVVPRNSQPPIDRSEPFGCGRVLAPRIFHKPIGFHPHRGRVVPDLERVVESIARGTHVGDRHYRRLRGNRRSFETAGLKPLASACHRWQTGRMISRASCAVTALLLSTVSGCASDSATRGIPGLCANASTVGGGGGRVAIRRRIGESMQKRRRDRHCGQEQHDRDLYEREPHIPRRSGARVSRHLATATSPDHLRCHHQVSARHQQVRDRRPVSQRRSACHRRQLRLPIARL